MLLRELSAHLKIEPFPSAQSGTPADPDGADFVLTANRDSGRLYRVAAPAPWGDWFVLRATANPEEPFTQATTAVARFKLTSHQPFQDVSIDSISKILQQWQQGRT
jgi:hypothetical protein